MINGHLYDWESIEIVAPNGLLVGATEITYNDERPVEARYGKGSIPRGWGNKNYKAGGSLTLDKDEYERFRLALGGGHYTKTPFFVTVSYANDQQPIITDILRDCLVTKADTSLKQEDDNTGQVKLDFEILSPIEWNGMPAYSEGRSGATGR
jgi:hypothetical protein